MTSHQFDVDPTFSQCDYKSSVLDKSPPLVFEAISIRLANLWLPQGHNKPPEFYFL
eukprot:jgi/Psemu1/41519/gm1.41519_g